MSGARVAARNAALLERIRDLKAEHRFWGYRRIWSYLRFVDGLVVNQKRVYGVMKAADLLVEPNLELRARLLGDFPGPRQAHRPRAAVGQGARRDGRRRRHPALLPRAA